MLTVMALIWAFPLLGTRVAVGNTRIPPPPLPAPPDIGPLRLFFVSLTDTVNGKHSYARVAVTGSNLFSVPNIETIIFI